MNKLYLKRDKFSTSISEKSLNLLNLRFRQKENLSRLQYNNNFSQMKYDLFLSYSTEEKENIVRPLANQLRDWGYIVWFDAHVMALGDSIKGSIDKGIINSDCAVIIISKSYLTKQWTKYELNWFAAKENTKGKHSIIPIWHDISPNEVDSFISTLNQENNELNSALPALVVDLIRDLAGKAYINTELGTNALFAKIVEAVPLKDLSNEVISAISKEDERSFLQTSYTIELYNEWHWSKFKKSIEYVENWISKLSLNNEPMIPLSKIEDIGGNLEYHVFEIIHFYEKWSLLSKSDVIDKAQVFKLLGIYSKYFEDCLIRPLIRAKEDNADFVNLLNLIEREILINTRK